MADILPFPKRHAPPTQPPATFAAGFMFTVDDVLAVRPDLTRDQAVEAGLLIVKMVRGALGDDVRATIRDLWPAITKMGGPA